jgi:hypothetical protein
MITVKLHGGLGNQMFQYAMARALSLRNHEGLLIDPSPLYDPTPWKHYTFRNYALSTVFTIDPKFNIPAKFESTVRIPYFAKVFNKYYPRLLGKLGYWRYIHDKNSYLFEPEIAEVRGDVYLDGDWQTEKYFKDFEREIRADFSFRNPLDGGKAAIAERIRNTNSVCLNVRRQEIVRDPVISAIHNIVTPTFYEEAIAIIKKKVGSDVTFFVVSDEIEWCRENMKIDGNHIFVGSEHYGVEFRDALHLMSLCKHFIIPNSSFAWWAAWLSVNSDKIVIAPKKWINNGTESAGDLLPEEWIAI